VLLANEMENIVAENFRRRAFIGDTTENWAKVKDPKRKGSAILVRSGRLKRRTRTLKADWSGVSIINDEKYAAIHNDGFSGKENVKGFRRKLANKKSKKKSTSGFTKISMKRTSFVQPFTRNMRMKRRRFMGDSQYAGARLERLAITQLKTIY
jgi:phage gpG-like protein